MLRGLRDVFREYAAKEPKVSKEIGSQIEGMEDLRGTGGSGGCKCTVFLGGCQELLEEEDLISRYELLIYKLVKEIQILNVKEEIQIKVKERVDKNQREYILREELKLIREELGDDTMLSDADEFQQSADALEAPDEVKEKLNKE